MRYCSQATSTAENNRGGKMVAHRRNIAAVITLLFVSPLVAEYVG